MTNLEEIVKTTLGAQAERDVDAYGLLDTVRSRGRRRRRRQRFLTAAAALVLVATTVTAAPALWRLGTGWPAPGGGLQAGGELLRRLPDVPEVPGAAIRSDLVGTDPAVLHFAADALTEGADIVRWRTADSYEELAVHRGDRLTSVLVGRDLSVLDKTLQPGAVTGTGTVAPTTVGGRAATVERIQEEASGNVGWVLRWQPVDGLWARLSTWDESDTLGKRDAAALNFRAARRCLVPFQLTAMPAGARIRSCELTIGPGTDRAFTEASVVLGDEKGRSMWIRAEHRAGRGSTAAENRRVGGRPAFFYPAGDQLDLLGLDGMAVGAYIGKAFKGYGEADATLVLAGLRPATPDNVGSWPRSLTN